MADVRLRMEADSALLEIEDAGKGIRGEVLEDSGELPPTGIGLRGMNERMRQLGGRLEISSNGHGTTVTASPVIGSISAGRRIPSSAGIVRICAYAPTSSQA